MNKTLSHKIRRIRCNPLFPCNIKKPQLLRVCFIHLFLRMRSAVPYSWVGCALPNAEYQNYQHHKDACIWLFCSTLH